MITRPSLAVVLLMLVFNGKAAAQNIIHLSASNDLFLIKAGTPVSFNGLVLNPSSDFTISGPNDIIKSNTIVHAAGNTYLGRVYQFSRTTTPFTGAITFYYLDNELNGLSENNLTLNVYNGVSWNAFTAGVRDVTANYVTTTGLSNLPLSELTLTSSQAPLPVHFTFFNAFCNGNSVILRWTTGSEINTSRFAIERSEDGASWQDIGNVKAAGNSSRETSYSYTDRNVAGSKRFYRVVEYSFSGSKTISSVLRSDCAAEELFSIYPNPVFNQVFININTSEAAKAGIRIYDSKGALVNVKDVYLLNGVNQFAVDVSRLASGTYTLTAGWNGQLKTTKLVKK